MNYHQILQRFYIKSRVSICKHEKKYFNNKQKNQKKIKIESQRSISLSIKLQDADQIHSHTWIDSLEEVFFLNFYLVFVIYEITYPNPHPPPKKKSPKGFPSNRDTISRPF